MPTTDSVEDSKQWLAGTRWRLDPSGSSAEFRVPHFWGLVTVRGRFGHFDGWLEVGENSRWRTELIIDAASLDTGNRKRDEHLRSGDFFDADHHPEVRFRSTSTREQGHGRVLVKGELEAAGERVPLELQASVAETHDAHLELDATATVDQRQLGMTWSPLGMTRTPAALTVHARLYRAR